MPSPTLRLHLLGGIAFKGLPDGEADALLAQSKVVGLLAYLALSPRGVFQRRDRLAAMLWPELDQGHARTALRKAIHVARTALGEAAVLGRGDEEVSLSEAITCDASDLRQAAKDGRLGLVLELYRGELMPGFHLNDCIDFESWLEEHRRDLQEEAVAACVALAQYLEQEDDFTEAAKYARKATRLDWSNERVLRRSLTMLDRLGDRAGALRLYEEFARRLKRELDADPSRETIQLIEALREGRTSA